LRKPLRTRRFGATLAVGYRGKVVLHPFGKLNYDAKARRDDCEYDV